MRSAKGSKSPTGPFANREPQNQEIGEFYVLNKHRATDFAALQLRKGRREASRQP